ncbi:hypothetical protein [uncultured Methanofollis sp.]|uniref:hypothetical protein n=1 Tax=uncultured Methanofollis sp. TaxID=262500 RepID=UPI00261E8C8F|nr:hypothetical protein [uncultured Methanofollis sp.]
MRGIYSYKWSSFPGEALPDIIRIEDIETDPIGIVRKKEKPICALDDQSRKRIPEDLKKHLVEEGDVLVTLTGPPFKCAVVDSTSAGLVISENIAAIRLEKERDAAPPEYIALYLNSPWGQKDLLTYATGAAHLRKITPDKLSRLTIPCPTPETQDAYDFVRAYYRHEKLRMEEQEVRTRLMTGILQKIFGRRR